MAARSGIGERDFGRLAPLRRRIPLRKRVQALPERCGVGEHDTGPVSQMAPPGAGRPRHVGKQRRRGLAVPRQGVLFPVQPREIVPGH